MQRKSSIPISTEITSKSPQDQENLSSASVRYSQYKNLNSEFSFTVINGATFHLEIRYEPLGTMDFHYLGPIIKAKDTLSAKGEDSIISIEQIQSIPSLGENDIRKILRQLKIQRLLVNDHIYGIKKLLLPKSRQEMPNIDVCRRFM